MTKHQKITERHMWRVASWISVSGTYRQALSYRCYLINQYGNADNRYYDKPQLAE